MIEQKRILATTIPGPASQAMQNFWVRVVMLPPYARGALRLSFGEKAPSLPDRSIIPAP